jgi:hypothetical protein
MSSERAYAGKNWVFTINNPTSEDCPKDWHNYKYLVYQLEQGEEGTKHLQGYVVFNSVKRMTALKKIHARAHWERRRGSHKEAKDYCMKEESRLEGPFEFGTEPQEVGKRETPQLLLESIKAGHDDKTLLEAYPGYILRYGFGRISDMRRCLQGKREWLTEGVLIWGDAGVGKSTWVRKNFPGAYWKSQDKWFDGYNGEDVIVIDDFNGYIPRTQLNTIIDANPCQLEVKGGKVQMLAKLVIITSNVPYHQFYKESVWGYNDTMRQVTYRALARRLQLNYYWKATDPDGEVNLNAAFDRSINFKRTPMELECAPKPAKAAPDLDLTVYTDDRYTATIEPPRSKRPPANDRLRQFFVKRRKGLQSGRVYHDTTVMRTCAPDFP